ncbi:Flp family type IVb pilin [Aurantimonas aggregata]|uniref:Flp family type IVb pilin n=1 Tax=Aurantimonas aggregata TaxID=2047720 RepID=A0A6L9MEG7_9HYPH|nr:Flp family type IVb pilin [Aurantimonas aggregata]NDV86254.1 Flp family type IVb pilin [Aurantimonas aggregata]
MSKLFVRFAKDKSGATAIEYALIAGLMATALIAIFATLGDNLTTAFASIGSSMQPQ